MKRLFLAGMVIMVLGLFSGFALSHQHGEHQGTMSQNQQEMQNETTKQKSEGEWICPWCGRKTYMGHGMSRMRHEGSQMGHGAMHESEQMGPNTMNRGKEHYRSHMKGKGHMRPTNKDEVKMLLDHYISNPNLKVGQITEKDEVFEARIVTKDNSLVEKVIVDKETGWMKKKY